MGKVTRMEKRHPETALKNLNRLTGLDFHSWPESLLTTGEEVARGDLTTPLEQQRGTALQCTAEQGR